MKLIKYFSIVLCLSLVAACGDPEEFFTPIVEIDLPPFKSKLVLFATFKAESDSLVVHLTHSRSALDTSVRRYTIEDTIRYPPFGPRDFSVQRYSLEGDTLKDAKVELFRNEVLFGTFKSNKFGKYILRQKIANDGATYRLRAEVAGYEVVEATQKMPPIVKLDSVRYVKDGAVIQDGLDSYKQDEFTFYFKDAPELGNHYAVQGTYFYKPNSTLTLLYPQEFSVASLDKLAQSDMLGDKSFNGKAYNWRNHGRLFYQQQRGERIEYKLITTTVETFQFVRSKELNDNAQGNPFAEPTILYTNVKNGYGLFSLSASSTWIKQF